MSQCYLNILFHLLPPANEVCGKVMFLQVSVILSTWGGMCGRGGMCATHTPYHAHPHHACPPSATHAPLCHTYPLTAMYAPTTHAPHACPPAMHAPCHAPHTHATFHACPPPPCDACPLPCIPPHHAWPPPHDMRSMSGRYASYWHVFLFSSVFVFFGMRIMQRLS